MAAKEKPVAKALAELIDGDLTRHDAEQGKHQEAPELEPAELLRKAQLDPLYPDDREVDGGEKAFFIINS